MVILTAGNSIHVLFGAFTLSSFFTGNVLTLIVPFSPVAIHSVAMFRVSDIILMNTILTTLQVVL